MSSSPARGSFTPSSQQTSKSLLSRLRLPLQSKARNFTDFYIQPDDPHRHYAPGEIITGSVILKVIKPLRITHLTISLHGYAQVFKNPNSPGDSYRNYVTSLASGKGIKSGGYFGNGFVSLFEDEAVLCGEGRLGEGVYHFNFELEFPSKGLPSSIDFERGTISYMLSSTITRPTTIAPTVTCDTKVYLADVIDVAAVPEPKPRVISLEAISRRNRTKNGPRRHPTMVDKTQLSADRAESMRSGRANELASMGDDTDLPGSPAPSDVSFESQLSSGAGSGTEYNIRSINTADAASSATLGSRTTLGKHKTITATIEVLKGGFLRGDQIPIRITVKHTKHVRSLKGIVMTLYRQARVDMHPALPVTTNSKGDKVKTEDYYPKSRTGLGGLSLSSAGSSHLFRKDISQSFAPLFVDPRSLTAEIKSTVRVPDEAFPTISNVPGAMISFKYFIEVVVDVQGKLTGLDRMFPNAGLISVPTFSSTSDTSPDPSVSMFSTWGGNFVDTEPIRREKGVISCSFEVVIGSKDSERNGKRRQRVPESETQDVHEIPFGPGDAVHHAEGGDPAQYDYDQYGQYYDYYGQGDYYDPYADPHVAHYHDPAYNPPENMESEEALSEKQRIRRAEQRLLPSQPPSEPGPSSSAGPSAPPGFRPSAPTIPEDECEASYAPGPSSSTHIHRHHHPPGPLPTEALPIPVPSAPPPSSSSVREREREIVSQPSSAPSTVIAGDTSTRQPPSSPAPEYFPPSSSSEATAAFVPPTDDKHELQRRRLELERSAPPPLWEDDGEQEQEEEGESSQSQLPLRSMVLPPASLQPSAPVIDDDDEDLVERMPRQRRARGAGGGAGGAGGVQQQQREDEEEEENRSRSSLPPYER